VWFLRSHRRFLFRRFPLPYTVIKTRLLRFSGGPGRRAFTAGGPRFGSPENTADSRPFLLNAPQPGYTTKARNERIQGVVRARVLVDSDGTVKKVKIITGLPYGLSYQAMDSAYQMIFRPAKKDGQPIEFWLQVEIEFRLT
jgi:TonB family protein